MNLNDKMRKMISYIKSKNNKNLLGAEIGVRFGWNAKSILENLDIDKLFLIDPFVEQTEKGIVWQKNYSDTYEIAKKSVEVFKHSVIFIKKESEYALDDVDNYLDFVYIDGNHLFKFVFKDISLYFSKVKKTGVIGGHDCHSLNVFIAILFFVLQNKTCYRIYFDDYDWWMDKNIKRGSFVLNFYSILFRLILNVFKTASIRGNIFTT